ncbi:TPA: LPXTG cell wall anchor domain-containing protein [Enterococcus faecalis]|uniref:LPXTG cell wall anchor domain-containing protein n=1 Tax=Enterococcus faecalis TaxID=1351 RepID=UPI00053BEF80|nr:LPXTG cell wall anchor domain-containing protein [Enterococcus faecalis]KII40131.1 hypothetical protein QR18_10735 [Enterococcus faecalis]HBI2085032.1 LPXTG cell wall anchor domain-containing protein [Enterococcus faecalis]HBK4585293.1 LPXTG cell wall anchor domain-containing protein [Enterococcus faecalis]
MRKRMLIITGFCFCGLLLLNPVFVKATEGKTEIEVNILRDASVEKTSENQSSENKKNTNDSLPKTGSKNQYWYAILGITLTLISGGIIIQKYLEEKNDEKN